MLDNVGFRVNQPTVPPQTQLATPPDSAAPERRPQRVRMLVAWAFGLGLLGWLLSHIPLAQLRDAIQRPSLGAWLLTLAGLLTSYLLRAARLQVVMGLDELARPTRSWLGLRTDALRVILMHNAAVNLLPMRAGELSFPWLASRHLDLPVARAVACLLWMRVQDMAVLLLLGICLWPGLDWAVRVGALLSMAGAWHMGNRLLAFWFERHGASATAAAGGKLGQLLNKVRSALLERAHHRPAAWGFTLANWALKLAAGASLLAAISGANWGTAWSGALGGELAAIVPLQGPAGFGTYEAGVWAGFATHLTRGSPVLAQAVAAALALHVCFLLCAVLAGAGAALLQHLTPSSDPQRGA